MLLKRLLNYLLGYCVIKVEGSRKESFINLVINAKIPLWDIVQKDADWLWAKVYVTDISKLRHIARKSRCPFKIVDKKGFPFIALRAEKRKGLVVGIILFTVTLYWLSSFIWFVDVFSNQPLELVSEEKILAEAARLGIRPGALKSRLSTDKIEHKLAVSLPQLTFVSIELEGTLAKIEVVEKKVIDEQNKEKPAHLVAAKDGIIEEILVLSGNPRASVGDTVQKGQVLISGIVSLKEIDKETGELIDTGLLQEIEAKGIVRARVWYEAVADAPIVETGKKRTGAKEEQWSLQVGEKFIILTGPRSSPPYTNFEEVRESRTINWRNLNMPVEVIQTIFYEVEPFRRNWGQDGAANNAKRLALKILDAKIPENAIVLERKFEVINQIGNAVKVRVFIETMEDIGENQRF